MKVSSIPLKKFFVVFFSLCIMLSCKAFTETFFSMGLGWNRCYEKVYSKYSILSELIWDEPFLIDCSVEEKISFSNFLVDFNIEYIIPNTWGIMKDFDYYITGAVSQFSSHSNHVDSCFSANIDIGYCFQNKKFDLFLFLGGAYIFNKFSAWDGYIQVPEAGYGWTGNEEKKNVNGNGITFEQKTLYPFVEVIFYIPCSNFFKLECKLSFSPFVYFQNIDIHYLRNIIFKDVIFGGFFIEPNIVFYWNDIGIYIDFKWFSSLQNGKIYKKKLGVNEFDFELVKNYYPNVDISNISIGIIYRL